MANEKRLIDANAIYDAVERRYQMSSGIEHRCERDLLDLICSADTVDAVEVVHSHWYYKGIDAVCRNCGFRWFDGCQECGVCPSDVNYCPNCGAKMDGDENA